MKLTIFGASGAIGRKVTALALGSGDRVTAYVRRAGSLEKNENLSVIVGQLTDQFLIEKAVRDADVVISTLGPEMDISRKNKGTPVGDGHELIVNVMERLGKKRFVTLATPSVHSDDDAGNFSTVVPPLLAKLVLPNAYRDMKKIEKVIKNSTLDWTVVRIINPNLRHRSSCYNVSLGDKPSKIGVSRDNAAAFIYKVAHDNSYIRKMPIVFNE